MVDPVSGRGYPAPSPRSPRPAGREGFPPHDLQERGLLDRSALDREALGREALDREGVALGALDRDARERGSAPRHLADNWEGPVSHNRPLPSRRHGLHWLLVIPVVPPLLIPLYNRWEPRLFGLPFFYWYQLACVVLAIVVIALVYQLTKGRRPRWPR